MVRIVPRRYHKSKWRITLFWVVGAVFILFGSMIAGSLQKTIGVTDISYALAILIAFVFFLIGGLLWISVSFAIKSISE